MMMTKQERMEDFEARLEKFLEKAAESKAQKRGRRKGGAFSEYEYADVIITFDIETTSYIDDGDKRAIVYSYAFSVDGEVFVMRHAEDFLKFYQGLVDLYDTGEERRIVIWCHNLAYEFQFIRAMLPWIDAFQLEERKVVKAVTMDGVEFRCSYALTGKGLARVAQELGMWKPDDYDYDLMRHSGTPLTNDELHYIYEDVKIVDALIRRQLREDTLETIPMTKTGYVRRNLRKRTLTKGWHMGQKYSEWIHTLNLGPQAYDMAKLAYQGGYTHANSFYSGMVMENVKGCDISSSYPASLVQYMYPSSNFVHVPEEDLRDQERVGEYLSNKACLIDIEFEDLESKTRFPPLSESRCVTARGEVADNGRVYDADRARTIITDVDFRTYMRAYDWPKFTIHSMMVADYEYLPTALIGGILELYAAKTRLKGLKDKVDEYREAKEQLNSIYGMISTDPVRVSYATNVHGEMTMVVEQVADMIHGNNQSRSRFTFYPWGTWVTAYSRKNLLDLIYDMEDAGIKVLYCDTDSIYYVDHDAADDLVTAANDGVETRMEQAVSHHLDIMEPKHRDPYFIDNLDEPRRIWAPLDRKGIERRLGIFEPDDYPIEQFKTLGAKRYAKVADGEFSVTVSGLPKVATPYIEQMGGMDFFEDGMHIPAEHAGRLIHTYSDEEISNVMTDYLGNTAEVRQEGYIHLGASDYTLNISDTYAQFLEVMGNPENGIR